MARRRNEKIKLRLILISLFFGAIIIVSFVLQQPSKFSFKPSAAFNFFSGTKNMCQKPCVVDYQCGRDQICAKKPGTLSQQKFCYNPYCPDNYQCGGEQCGGICRAPNEKDYIGGDWPNYQDCINSSCETSGKHLCKKDIISETYRCVTKICEYDYLFTASSFSLDTNYLKTRKKSSCPVKDRPYCPHGYICDELEENGETVGVTFTRISGEGQSFLYLQIGVGCICDSELCRDGEFRQGVEVKMNESVKCRFDTARCEGPS